MARKVFSRIILIITSFALIFIAILLILNKQYIVDQITVWRYNSTSEIELLVDNSGMNDYGKFLFYASQPQLQSSIDFNESCTRVEKVTSVLGCYNNNKIYLYDINNTQLDGIREVTAAHEMLHAVYARLNYDEKTKIDELLENEYKKLESNKDFTDRMAFYARTEPGQRGNELHSVIGTEISSISLELENHYKKYFYNRQLIVDLNNKYISVFQNLENRANALKIQLNSLGADITERSDQYNKDIQTLNTDISNFNYRANNGLFSSQSEFNTERSTLTERINELNLVRTQINDDSNKYNSLLLELESIASESKKLYNSIDSTLAPVPSI